jgi:hypothetical protein
MTHRPRASLRHAVSISIAVAGLCVPSLAMAQAPAPAQQGSSANCPPGSWFCADAQQQPAAPPNQPVPGQAGPLQPLPPPQTAQPAPPPTIVYQPAPPPPVVVYQPPPPVYVVRPEAPPPPFYYRPEARPRREWGLNLHLQGASIGRGVNGDANMGGAGFGLRYKPVPHFGLEADLDFMGGRDYNSMKRNETAFSLNGLVFLNPKSKGQIYLLGGIGWSAAHAVNDQDFTTSNAQQDFHYAYFGAQAGVGIELRLGRHFALNGDVRGFIRGRIDDNAQFTQEFHDAAGRSSNTSGGGLLTLGATFYF